MLLFWDWYKHQICETFVTGGPEEQPPPGAAHLRKFALGRLRFVWFFSCFFEEGMEQIIREAAGLGREALGPDGM